MPTGVKSMNNQLDNIQDLLEPVFKKRKSNRENEREMGNTNDKKNDENRNNSLEDASLYYSNAMKSIMTIVKDKAESYLNRDKYPKKKKKEKEKASSNAFVLMYLKNVLQSYHLAKRPKVYTIC